MPGTKAFIHELLRSMITEYSLLEETALEKTGFKILIARLDFVIYIFIEDDLGLHCVEWFENASEVQEKLQYWRNRLQSGITKVRTFNIPPDSLKSHERILIPKKENQCT